jgi:tyrosyl-tRNA synthetase
MGLARRIITDFHSDAAAQQAADNFRHVFQERENPSHVESRAVAIGDIKAKPDGVYIRGTLVQIKLDRLLAKAGLASSVSEAGRKLKEGAVVVNGERRRELLLDIDSSQKSELLVKLGRHHLRVILEP